MTSAFEQFEFLEREGWRRVADKYEDAWSGKTRPFIRHLLEAARVTAGHRFLDVACGPGYVAEAAPRWG
jgi:ubiquinone/menaquinone biosynthesis C-methylase UbiE